MSDIATVSKERYVALLGSINVGGNRLKMADLREALVKRGPWAGAQANNLPVSELILDRLPATLLLSGSAFVFSLALGVVLEHRVRDGRKV